MENKITIISPKGKDTLSVDYVKFINYDFTIEIKLSDNNKELDGMTYKQFRDRYFNFDAYDHVDVKLEGEQYARFIHVHLINKEEYLCGWEYYDWNRTFMLKFDSYEYCCKKNGTKIW